jgi:hypothetical protein
MSKTYGYNTRIKINGQPYRVSAGRTQMRADTHDVSDTESTPSAYDGSPRRERGPGLGEAELTLTAFSDPSIGIHVAPYNIRIQQRVPLIEIYGDGEDEEPDVFRDTLIDDVSKDPVGDPQQPNRISFHGFCQDFSEAGTT